jgi:hypothetical protein
VTSGKPITEVERWSVLRMNWQGCSHGMICETLRLDPRTVAKIINEAAATYYDLHKPTLLDRLKLWP